MENDTMGNDVTVTKQDGQNKCPKCGATDISLNVKNGTLRCNFCRHEFEAEKNKDIETDISKLEGDKFSSGTKDIDRNADNIITLKCSSCGAEVVIDTENSTQARCHWCRNMLSINNQIPNGAVPDVVLPFKLTKKDAQELINKYVGKRKFFANTVFRREFTTDNIMGVYFPYMVIDVNAHANLAGEAEHEIRRYTEGDEDHETTYYDADVYEVEREFDIAIQGLTVESSIDKLDTTSKKNTNNVINSIMPFDTENCAKWDPNYLKGYTSEKRDMDVEKIKPIAEEQAKDIMRYAAKDSMEFYDRGAHWEKEEYNIKGTQWQSAYLPVWLYSYMQKKNNKEIMHYVAVNARTQEVCGSVPINKLKLFGITSLIAAIIAIIGYVATQKAEVLLGVLIIWLVFVGIKYGKYRSSGARHDHETSTKKEVTNLRKVDNKIKTRRRLTEEHIKGHNSSDIRAKSVANKIVKEEKKNEK